MDIVRAPHEAIASTSFDNQRLDIPVLDLYLQGYPTLGKRFATYGNQNTGKSTLLTIITASLVRTCKKCLTKARSWGTSKKPTKYSCKCGENDFFNVIYLDVEGRMTHSYLSFFGAKVDEFEIIKQDDITFKYAPATKHRGAIIVFQSQFMEEMYEMIRGEFEKGDFQAVICDALNSPSSMARFEEGKIQPGDLAKRHWEGFRNVLTSQVKASRKFGYVPTLGWANHVTSTIDMSFFNRGGPSEEQSGGKGPKFFQDQAVLMLRSQNNPKKDLQDQAIFSVADLEHAKSDSPVNRKLATLFKFKVEKNVAGMYEGFKGDYCLFYNHFKKLNKGVFKPGDSWDAVKLVGYCTDLGLIDSTKHSSKTTYRFMGFDFPSQKSLIYFLKQEQYFVEARYWVAKMISSEMARPFLLKEKILYNPDLDIKRVEKVETEVNQILADLEDEYSWDEEKDVVSGIQKDSKKK